MTRRPTRRAFLASAALGAAGAAAYQSKDDPHAGKALIAITLDLEMSRNFPRWEDTHWDYEKGNLNDETKRPGGPSGKLECGWVDTPKRFGIS